MITPTDAVIAAARALLEKSVEWQQAFPDSAVPDPVDHAAATLRAALAAYDAAPDGWLPIESAPRDGRKLLMIEGDRIQVCYPKLFPRPIDDENRHLKPSDWPSKPGDLWEYFRDDEWAKGHTWAMRPTHWRPLPPPPETPHE